MVRAFLVISLLFTISSFFGQNYDAVEINEISLVNQAFIDSPPDIDSGLDDPDMALHACCAVLILNQSSCKVRQSPVVVSNVLRQLIKPRAPPLNATIG